MTRTPSPHAPTGVSVPARRFAPWWAVALVLSACTHSPVAPPGPGPSRPAVPMPGESPRPSEPSLPAPAPPDRPAPEPDRGDRRLIEQGIASWYGGRFHGRRTASGERFDKHAMTAAHRTAPMSSHLRVRNLSNGRAVVVRVNDRGPFVKGRVIDLSQAAARALGIHGLARVEIERVPAP